MSSLAVDTEFRGEDVVIEADEIERFCRVVGNEQPCYKGKSATTAVPMDFAIKLGWKGIMKAIVRFGLIELG